MSARAWLVGDDINTDVLAPGKYMRGGIVELAKHTLEAVRPDFAGGVRPGDVLVAGRNFGAGSSREQAAEALKHLGLAAVLAKSFAGIFYRNAINLGLPVLVCADAGEVADGAVVRFDLEAATLEVKGRDAPIACEPMPDFLRAMIADGGLVPHLEKRFTAEGAAS